MSKTSPARRPGVIAITSHVAGNAVGGGVTSAVMQARGVRLALAPTVLMGRHPGKGAPGGGPVDPDQLAGVLDGLTAEGWVETADALFLGYFSTPEQVEAAASFARKARDLAPGLLIVLDPILGDGAGQPNDAQLYVRPETAQAVRLQLAPLADLVTPNLFELAWLTRRAVESETDIADAARELAPEAVITSAPAPEGQIGVITVDALTATSLSTRRMAGALNGAGDLFAADLLAGRLFGETTQHAAADAAARVGAVFAASDPASGELEISQDTLSTPIQRPLSRRIGADRPAFAMGVDGCPTGWCGVLVDLNGVAAPWTAIFPDFQAVLDVGAHIIAVDMPIGFEDRPGPDGMRRCERLARDILGPRRSSIFPSPLRTALAAPSYRDAVVLNRAAGGKGLSKQGWNLFPKLREIDALITAQSENFVFETHPETSFAVMSGAPAAHAKKTPEGRMERLALLERHGLARDLFEPHPFKRKDAAPDDVVDAGLCALTAMRIAAGTAQSLPDRPPRDARGLRMAIFA